MLVGVAFYCSWCVRVGVIPRFRDTSDISEPGAFYLSLPMDSSLVIASMSFAMASMSFARASIPVGIAAMRAVKSVIPTLLSPPLCCCTTIIP